MHELIYIDCVSLDKLKRQLMICVLGIWVERLERRREILGVKMLLYSWEIASCVVCAML